MSTIPYHTYHIYEQCREQLCFLLKCVNTVCEKSYKDIKYILLKSASCQLHSRMVFNKINAAFLKKIVLKDFYVNESCENGHCGTFYDKIDMHSKLKCNS